MKRLKIKKKNIIILFIVIILLVVVLRPVISIAKIKVKGYSFSSAVKIYKEGIKKIVLEKDYSKTLDKIITTDFYNEKRLNDYFDIKYVENELFNENITNMLEIGYDTNVVNKIYEKNDNELIKILTKKYVKDILEYVKYDYFKLDKLDRYISYYNGDYSDTIIKVNIGLDKKFYEDPTIVTEYSTDVLVNKYNKLDSNFKPPEIVELTKCSDKGHYLSKEAKQSYDELCEASLKSGLSLGVTSSYRSYEDQEKTYNYYLKNNGKEYVEKYGFSEHQTGLSLDVKSTVTSPFKTSKESLWIKENAYKYGFILRYPEGMEEITGYNAEAWHFRYVGKDIAKYIHDNNITFDEYCAIFM